jgi:hypothetical protein
MLDRNNCLHTANDRQRPHLQHACAKLGPQVYVAHKLVERDRAKCVHLGAGRLGKSFLC